MKKKKTESVNTWVKREKEEEEGEILFLIILDHYSKGIAKYQKGHHGDITWKKKPTHHQFASQCVSWIFWCHRSKSTRSYRHGHTTFFIYIKKAERFFSPTFLIPHHVKEHVCIIFRLCIPHQKYPDWKLPFENLHKWVWGKLVLGEILWPFLLYNYLFDINALWSFFFLTIMVTFPLHTKIN